MLRRVADDFDQNYVIDPDTGCWLWIRAYAGNGRGMLRYAGGNLCAHTVAWIRRHGGPPPAGMVLISRCRVLKCCNPDHYYVGTRGEAWHAAQGVKHGYEHGASTRVALAPASGLLAQAQPSQETRGRPALHRAA